MPVQLLKHGVRQIGRPYKYMCLTRDERFCNVEVQNLGQKLRDNRYQNLPRESCEPAVCLVNMEWYSSLCRCMTAVKIGFSMKEPALIECPCVGLL